MTMERKRRIFFDMDGTLNEWTLGDHIDKVSEPGYMRERIPIKSVVEASLLLEAFGYEVWIASAVLPFEHSVPDKDYWLDKVCPWIAKEHRVYMPYGTNKADALADLVDAGDVFLDDYTPNLIDLDKRFSLEGVVCVKILNGINDTNHSWKGKRISIYSDAESIFDTITAFSKQASLPETKVEPHISEEHKENLAEDEPLDGADNETPEPELKFCAGIPYVELPSGTTSEDILWYSGLPQEIYDMMRYAKAADEVRVEGFAFYGVQYDDGSYVCFPQQLVFHLTAKANVSLNFAIQLKDGAAMPVQADSFAKANPSLSDLSGPWMRTTSWPANF